MSRVKRGFPDTIFTRGAVRLGWLRVEVNRQMGVTFGDLDHPAQLTVEMLTGQYRVWLEITGDKNGFSAYRFGIGLTDDRYPTHRRQFETLGTVQIASSGIALLSDLSAAQAMTSTQKLEAERVCNRSYLHAGMAQIEREDKFVEGDLGSIAAARISLPAGDYTVMKKPTFLCLAFKEYSPGKKRF